MKTAQVMIPWYVSSGLARDVNDVWVIQKVGRMDKNSGVIGIAVELSIALCL